MSNFNNASLIVTPNSKKAGKLYSLKPTDGAGDLDVVRATSATRVNEQGLIEIPRTNLLLRSEGFDNATWEKTASTVTANATTSPSGTMTADKIIETTASSIHSVSITVSFPVNTVGCISLFCKKSERSIVYLGGLGRTPNQNEGYVWFDLNNGTVLTQNSGYIGKIEYVGNEWYRISVVTPLMTSSVQKEYRFGLTTTSGIQTYTGNGTSGIYIWGAQLEVGNVATEYIPTTSVIRTRFAGITQDGGSASNIPRIDYTNGSCPSILVEPQRTNLLLRSEEFDNSYWNKTSGLTPIVLANSTVSPSSLTDADKITPNSTLATHWIGKTGFSLTSGVTYSYSVFAKNNGFNVVLSVGDLTVYTNCNFNLSTGTTSTPYNTAGSNLCVPSIVDYGNGWYRCIITFTAWTASNALLFSANNNTTTPISSFGMAPITGNSSNGFYLWGAQLEVGSNATSYIPTVASTVTRNSDVISKTGLSGITSITETFENGTTNVISGSPTSYTMSQGRIKHVIGI